MSVVRTGGAQCLADAVVLAGQLESSLWDGAYPCATCASALTDALAQCFFGGSGVESNRIDSIWAELLAGLPEVIRISEPEGFAYYALHPGDFADGVSSFAQRNPVALIGIRSIGTTLSAVAMAKLRKNQTPASRITVRPTLHPYDRRNSFTPSQSEWVDQNVCRAAIFLVLDEGPGLSGSSFLSVAESLMGRGVRPDRIFMIGTRDCDPKQLCAVDAAHRWGRFGWQKVGSRIYTRFADSTFLGAGTWREQLLPSEREWPSCWTGMESLRFLTSDRKYIAKFEGFGATGKSALERAQAIHEAEFGPSADDIGDGMHSYSFVPGQPLSRLDVTAAILDRIAKYCAFRDAELTNPAEEDPKLREMVQFNFSQETGSSIDLPVDWFRTHSTVVDGRMQPHEWIRSAKGEVLKIDAVQHGDDHFLPGPTDIAWDLAGAIVEWNLDNDGARYLHDRFWHYTGRNLTDRLPYFVLAYSTFRSAYCKMAEGASQDSAERVRLQHSSAFYRRKMLAVGQSTLIT